MTRNRMLFLSSVPSSRRRYRFSSIISVLTSARGRFQFSTENAYSVSTPMPSRAERFDDVADRVDAGAMAFDARQMALRRPAPVAVHDDGDVGRQLLEIDLPRQRFVGRSRRNPRQQLLKRHYGSLGVNRRVYRF